MKLCSYTWIEWDAEKNENVRNWCPEKIWEDSKEYCIFHDLSKEKNIGFFRQKLMEKLDSKDYNFRGYCFPTDVDFSNKKFEKNVHFDESTFHGNAKFSGVSFQSASFYNATFQDVSFNGASFHDVVSFEQVTFLNAAFIGTTFKKAVFDGATFLHNADFGGAKFQYASFDNATLQDVSFNGTTFKKVFFDEAIFEKNAYFRKATFQCDVSFDRATFRDAVFDKATFQCDVSFDRATFRDAVFDETTFINVSFNETIFERYLKFAPKDIGKLSLQDTQFLIRGYITADLTRTKFHQVDLENVTFINCKWPENQIFEETCKEDEDGFRSFKDLEIIYRNLKQNMQHNGNYSKAGRFFYREMEMKRRGAEKKRDRLWLGLYRLLAGYGEHPLNTVAVSLGVVLTFALLYWRLGCLQYTVINSCLSQQIIDALYFSFVTFTTLGLGDIQPITSSGKVLICCEAVIGAFLIALFVVVFVRKMAR